jgi:hypothetical protein
MNTLSQLLSELRALGEKATPRPWKFTEETSEAWIAQTDQAGGKLICDPPEGRFKDYADRFRNDAALIVAAVNAADALAPLHAALLEGVKRVAAAVPYLEHAELCGIALESCPKCHLKREADALMGMIGEL